MAQKGNTMMKVLIHYGKPEIDVVSRRVTLVRCIYVRFRQSEVWSFDAAPLTEMKHHFSDACALPTSLVDSNRKGNLPLRRATKGVPGCRVSRYLRAFSAPRADCQYGGSTPLV